MDVLKPFLMLACAAFVVGFMGYLGMARLATTAEAPSLAEAQIQPQPQDPQSSATSMPTTADDWNAGKRI